MFASQGFWGSGVDYSLRFVCKVIKSRDNDDIVDDYISRDFIFKEDDGERVKDERWRGRKGWWVVVGDEDDECCFIIVVSSILT